MNFTSVPIIVVCCYIIGEIYKVLFKKHEEAYKLIPIIMAIVGGLFGILIYLTNKEIIFNLDCLINWYSKWYLKYRYKSNYKTII